MTSKHTPGPWPLETVRTSCGVCHRVGRFPRNTVVDKFGAACIYVDYPGGGDREEELLANARLIAAAPELYEALEEILLFVPVGYAPTARPHACVDRNARLDAAMRAAVAAIAKARGEI